MPEWIAFWSGFARLLAVGIALGGIFALIYQVVTATGRQRAAGRNLGARIRAGLTATYRGCSNSFRPAVATPGGYAAGYGDPSDYPGNSAPAGAAAGTRKNPEPLCIETDFTAHEARVLAACAPDPETPDSPLLDPSLIHPEFLQLLVQEYGQPRPTDGDPQRLEAWKSANFLRNYGSEPEASSAHQQEQDTQVQRIATLRAQAGDEIADLAYRLCYLFSHSPRIPDPVWQMYRRALAFEPDGVFTPAHAKDLSLLEVVTAETSCPLWMRAYYSQLCETLRALQEDELDDLSEQLEDWHRQDPLPRSQAEAIALARQELGERPSFSTGICGQLTCGYGRLSTLGYWEFPLPEHAWPHAEKYPAADRIGE